MPTEPRASYRIQLEPGRGFRETARLVPYLAELGVSHLYLSPVFEARAGSAHGYDVVDFTRTRAELGGEEGLEALFEAARRHGLGVLLDVVPNHMAAAGPENPWWWSVLESGRTSPFADFFDIDWEEAAREGGLIQPVLGAPFGEALESGALRAEHEEGRFRVRFADHVFPLAPAALAELLAPAAEASRHDLLGFVARGLAELPAWTRQDAEARRRTRRDLPVLKRLLEGALEDEAAREATEAELARVHADADRLEVLLGLQPYRLAFWRIASRKLAHRRFFDIDTLVALRMEDPEVFAASHARALRWLDEGRIDGLRIDHVDGLRDPDAYLRQLRELAPRAWLLVEKILEPGESLPERWPVDGTTGYDLLGVVDGLFVDPEGEAPLTRLYASFTGQEPDFGALLVASKRQVLERLFGPDLARLTRHLAAICRRHRRHRDETGDHLARALEEVIAHVPVYRTYVRPGEPVAEADRRRIEEAVEGAREATRGALRGELLDFVRDLLLLRVPGELEEGFAAAFQQLSGPAMAKGAEDTAFYVHQRFVMLNEVGGDPARFGVAPEDFLRHCQEARARAPRGLLAGSTHDTKRGEDVRARLALLSEMPRDWEEATTRWAALNARHRRGDAPARSHEYLLYQTLVGAWPIGAERIRTFLEKAVREGKQYSSWRDPDPEYEAALLGFAEAALADERFVAELRAFVEPLIEPGRVNALAGTLLRMTAPGVPDIYQGSELWNLSLVDPDNRRPVDFEARRALLRECAKATPEAVLRRADEGAPKLWVIRRALELRARRPELFAADAAVTAPEVKGARRQHAVALLRGEGALAVVPRLVLGLGGDWGDTELALPPGAWTNRLTGERMGGGSRALAELLARFPVALLEREATG